MGETANLATRRKEILIEQDLASMFNDTLHVINLLPDDILLSIARICDINKGGRERNKFEVWLA